MKKDSIFLHFMVVIAVVGALLAAAAAYIISVPLVETLTEAEVRPLHLIIDDIFGIASDSFHDLLDERKEDDPVEVESAKQNVLARISYYKPSILSQDYHYVVIGGDNRILADPGRLFEDSFGQPISDGPAERQVQLIDRNGNAMVGYLRYFPAWDWRFIALIHEEDLRKETSKIRAWIYGAGIAGCLLLITLIYAILRKRIQKPLEELVRYASRLEEGSYERLPTVGKGEVGELSAAFDRMTAAIRDREMRLAALAKFSMSNPNILMKVSPEGNVLFANPSVSEKLSEMGLAADQAAMLLPSDIEGIRSDLAESEDRKKELLWNVMDRSIEYTVFGFADEDAIVFHGIDVTERKRMEEQLFHAHKMETLGRIAGGVAHDFNNLLTGILGYASLMKGRPLPDEGLTKALESIEKAAERGTQLTRQLLGFARKGTHEYLPLDLNRIVEETADIISQTIFKTIRIKVDMAKDLPSVSGDYTQLHQCLMNLCINARDAMPDGGTLEISTRARVLESERREKHSRIPAGRYAEMVVADEGQGMDDATQQRIFDPFFTTKERNKGTGLGMSMVYGIVKSHGGFITVRSAPGKGTSVEILFPVAEPGRTTGMAQETLPDMQGPGGREGGTVLLVDDEEFVRDVGKAMLNTMGYNVMTAENGKEGVDIFQRNREKISIVLLDLIMPVMDGRRAFEEIRRIDPGARVVISTGYSGNEDVDRLKEMGASGVLAKPYSYNSMMNLVNRLDCR